MDKRLQQLLEALMNNIGVINTELDRLTRTEQFRAEPASLQMLEQLREGYYRGMETLRRVEIRLHRPPF